MRLFPLMSTSVLLSIKYLFLQLKLKVVSLASYICFLFSGKILTLQFFCFSAGRPFNCIRACTVFSFFNRSRVKYKGLKMSYSQVNSRPS